MEAGGFRRCFPGRIFYHIKRGYPLTTLHTLASGSSGNALLVSCGQTHLLIDAGISCRRISNSLQMLGLSLQDLTAILITHTHSDHISGLQTMLKKTAVPVLGTASACNDLLYRNTLPSLNLLLAYSLLRSISMLTSSPVVHSYWV